MLRKIGGCSSGIGRGRSSIGAVWPSIPHTLFISTSWLDQRLLVVRQRAGTKDTGEWKEPE